MIRDETRMLNSWRGRWLLMCRTIDTIDRIIENIGNESGNELPPEGGFPVLPKNLRDEMGNLAAILLRMVLAANDGHTSNQKVHRY